VRGVEAGRAGTGPEAGPVILDVCAGIIGLERFVKGGWLGDKKEKGWEIVGDWVGNGFEFGDGNWFGLVTFGAELFVGTVNGLAFAAAGNGFIVCPVPGNGFVGCVFGLVGKGLVPSNPFCAEKGFGTIGTGGGGFVWPNGESPVACMGKVLARKGFAPVICD
jgi:hypothetical protein